MRRGRWVAYCIAILLLISPFSCVIPTYGVTLSMTATVPLSSAWKEALRTNSQAKIDTSRPHILLVSQESLGIDKLPVDKQNIYLFIFKNNVLVSDQTKITDKKGFVEFVYVSEKPGVYSVIIVNKLDDKPFVVKSAIVSI